MKKSNYTLENKDNNLNITFEHNEEEFSFKKLVDIKIEIMNQIQKETIINFYIKSIKTRPHIYAILMIIEIDKYLEKKGYFSIDTDIEYSLKLSFLSYLVHLSPSNISIPKVDISVKLNKTLLPKERIQLLLQKDFSELFPKNIFFKDNIYNILEKSRRRESNKQIYEFISLHLRELLDNLNKHAQNANWYYIAKPMKKDNRINKIMIIIYDDNKNGILDTLEKRLEEESNKDLDDDTITFLKEELANIQYNPQNFFQSYFNENKSTSITQIPHYLTHFGIPAFVEFTQKIASTFEVISSYKNKLLTSYPSESNKYKETIFQGTIYNIEIEFNNDLIEESGKYFKTYNEHKYFKERTPDVNLKNYSYKENMIISNNTQIIKTFKFNESHPMDFFRNITEETSKKKYLAVVIYNLPDYSRNIFQLVFHKLIDSNHSSGIVILFFTDCPLPYVMGGKNKEEYKYLNLTAMKHFGGTNFHLEQSPFNYFNDKSNSYIGKNPLFVNIDNEDTFIPLDLIIEDYLIKTNTGKNYLFEYYLYNEITKNHYLPNLHTELTEEIHVSDFYQVRKIFQDSFWTNKYAHIIATDIYRDISKTKKIKIVGHKLFSLNIITDINNILLKYEIDSTYEIYDNNYIKDIDSREVFLIAPASTTLQSIQKISKRIKDRILKTYYVIITVDKENYNNKYYKLIPEVKSIKNTQNKYFLTLPISWSNSNECKYCYSEKPKAIFQINDTLTPLAKNTLPETKRHINSLENIHLLHNSLDYGHFDLVHSHHLHSIITPKLLEKKKEIMKYLSTIVKPKIGLNNQNKNILIVPGHYASSIFASYVKSSIFMGSTEIIYVENLDNELEKITSLNAYRNNMDIYFIDDALITTKTFDKTYNLLVKHDLIKYLRNIIVLLDKSSPLSIRAIHRKCQVRTNRAETFIQSVIPLQTKAINDEVESCFMCKKENEYIALLENSNLDSTRYELLSKIEKNKMKKPNYTYGEQVKYFIKLFINEFIYSNVNNNPYIKLFFKRNLSQPIALRVFKRLYKKINIELQKTYQRIVFNNIKATKEEVVFFQENIDPLIKLEVYLSLLKSFSYPYLNQYRYVKENIFTVLSYLLETILQGEKSLIIKLQKLIQNNKNIQIRLQDKIDTIKNNNDKKNLFDIIEEQENIKKKEFYEQILYMYESKYININKILIVNFLVHLLADLKCYNLIKPDQIRLYMKLFNTEKYDKKTENSEMLFISYLISIKKLLINPVIKKELINEITKLEKEYHFAKGILLEIYQDEILNKNIQKVLENKNLKDMFINLRKFLLNCIEYESKPNTSENTQIGFFLDLNFNNEKPVELADVFNEVNNIKIERDEFIYDAFKGLSKEYSKSKIVYSQNKDSNNWLKIWMNIYIDKSNKIYYKDSEDKLINSIDKLYSNLSEQYQNLLAIRFCHVDEENPTEIKPMAIIVLASENKINNIHTCKKIISIRNMITSNISKLLTTDILSSYITKQKLENSVQKLSHSNTSMFKAISTFQRLQKKKQWTDKETIKLIKDYSIFTHYNDLADYLKDISKSTPVKISKALSNNYFKKLVDYNNARKIKNRDKRSIIFRNINLDKFYIPLSIFLIEAIFFEFIKNVIKNTTSDYNYESVISIYSKNDILYIQNTGTHHAQNPNKIFALGNSSVSNSSGFGLYYIEAIFNKIDYDISHFIDKEENTDFTFGLKIRKNNDNSK